jgi:hypothetical protein
MNIDRIVTFVNIQKYIIYYTRDVYMELSDWQMIDVSGEYRNVTIVTDNEQTTYFVRIQAATDV